MINELNTTVNNQAIKINELNNTVNDLKEDNKALREDNKILREDNKFLKEEIKELNREIILINGTDLDMSFKDGSKYTVKVIDNNGSPVPNAKVIIKVNTVSYDCYTNTEGIASLPIGLNPGTYTITATHGKNHI